MQIALSEAVDRFVDELTVLSRKYGLVVYGFDGGAFVALAENPGHLLCNDGDLEWDDKEHRYSLKDKKGVDGYVPSLAADGTTVYVKADDI